MDTKRFTMNEPAIWLCVLILVNLGQTHPPRHSPNTHPPRHASNYAPPYSPTSFAWTSDRECSGKFRCQAGDTFFGQKCVDTYQVCDSFCDCKDCSDEALCPKEPECFSNKQMICLDKRSCATPCNGRRECPTMGEDELGCPFNCPDGHYRCKGEERCIRIDEICDKKRDCLLGEDESKCDITCGNGQYLCNDRKTCVSLAEVCDSNRDCPDGDDEAFCDITCGNGQYLCNDRKTCVSLAEVCDVDRDCPDGDDETFCDLCNCEPGQNLCSCWYAKSCDTTCT